MQSRPGERYHCAAAANVVKATLAVPQFACSAAAFAALLVAAGPASAQPSRNQSWEITLNIDRRIGGTDVTRE